MRLNSLNSNLNMCRRTEARNIYNQVKMFTPSQNIIKDPNSTIDDFYHQTMALTKSFCLIHGLEHDVISNTILDAYNGAMLRCDSAQRHNDGHIEIDATHFRNTVIDSLEKTCESKEETVLLQGRKILNEFLNDLSVKFQTLPKLKAGERQPIEEKKTDMAPNESPEHIARMGRMFETLCAKAYLSNLPMSTQKTVQKFYNFIADRFDANALNDVYLQTYSGLKHPTASENLAQKLGFTKIYMNKVGDLSAPQILERFGWLLGMHGREINLPETHTDVERKIQSDLFDPSETYHMREKGYASLRGISSNFPRTLYENLPPKIGTQHRSHSVDAIPVIKEDFDHPYLAGEPLKKLKRSNRPVDISDQKVDVNNNVMTGYEQGYPVDKSPSGCMLITITLPFIFAEKDQTFDFSRDDFQNLYKFLSSILTLCGGHSEHDTNISVRIAHKIISDTQVSLLKQPEKQNICDSYTRILQNFEDAFMLPQEGSGKKNYQRRLPFIETSDAIKDAWETANHMGVIEDHHKEQAMG